MHLTNFIQKNLLYRHLLYVEKHKKQKGKANYTKSFSYLCSWISPCNTGFYTRWLWQQRFAC